MDPSAVRSFGVALTVRCCIVFDVRVAWDAVQKQNATLGEETNVKEIKIQPRPMNGETISTTNQSERMGSNAQSPTLHTSRVRLS